MTGPYVDQPQRDRLVEDLDRTLFVEAGAGTGKTTAVVSRVVALVADGRLVMERLVAITFTIAAAGELRVRIREALESAAAATSRPPDARARCGKAAGEVDRARIETIHGFCATLLRMHPLEAGLPPDFEILAEVSSGLDVRERFREWFSSVSATPAREAMRRGFLLGVTPTRLLSLFTAMDANWDLLGAEPSWNATVPGGLAVIAHAIGADLAEAVALLPHCHTTDLLADHVEELRPAAYRLQHATGDDDALAAVIAYHRSPRPGNRGNQGNWHEGVCKRVKAHLKEARSAADDVVTAAQEAVACSTAHALRDAVLLYAEERRIRGLVSYQDLLVRARDLVQRHPAVLSALHRTWDAIIVDEFQDTDPLQAELAFRIAAEPGAASLFWTDLPPVSGRLCVVGDPKQSIYRFRRADIAIYDAVQRALTLDDADARVSLQVNFRSGQRIVDAVNAVFGGPGGLMGPAAEDGVQATYVDLVAHRPDIDGSVRVFGGPVEGKAAAMWSAEADGTATAILRILAERWTVDAGKEAGPRPCTSSDICILMPSRTNLRNLERALENARVRYRLDSGSLMVATQEVRDLLNCLRCIDDPTDEVALVAALRSPAYACSDVDLLRWREAGGWWTYQRPGPPEVPRVSAAISDLLELHRLGDTLTVPALVEELISRRLLRAAAADDWRPRETLRRQRYVLEQVRALTRAGRTTLHDAVDYLERLAADPHYDSVASDSDDEDCVRVMTIHAAKGLEFPIVLVTGLGRKPLDFRAQVATSRVGGRVEVKIAKDFTTPGWSALAAREDAMQAAERVRLLYVALTRARDHLVVSGFRGATQGDATDAYRVHSRLLELDGVAELDVAVAPSPSVQSHPEADTGHDSDAHRTEEATWVAQREALLARFGALRATTATAVAGEPDALSPEASGDVAAQRRGRGGTSLGRAVHAVLQVLDLRSLDGIADHVAAQAAAEGIRDRAAEVERLVRATCATAAVQRAARARHWRELPVGAGVDGVIVEGFIDLLYEDPDGRLVVLDYKTDAVAGAAIEARFARYRLQGGVYALLVGEVTGREVARIEFVFAAAGETRSIGDVAAVVAEVREALAAAS